MNHAFSEDPEVSLLILALNEAESLGEVLAGASKELTNLGVKFEIVVVDGGSKDNTVEIAKQAGATVHIQNRSGYAAALCEGFALVRGRYIITLDGDCSHPSSLIPSLMACRTRYHLVIGSRWIPGGSFRGSPLRAIMSRTLSIVFRRLLSLPLHDLSSGYRLYDRRVLEPSIYKCRDFSILQEILIRSFVEGYSSVETPLPYEERRGGRSHVHLISFAMSYLRALARLMWVRYDANACDYDNRAFDSMNLIQRYWQRSRFSNIMGLLGEYRHSGRVIDIGCGSSRIIQSLPHAVAFDASPKKLRFLAPTNPRRVCGSALALPFADGVFDCVIHSQLIEHLPMERSIFSEVRRIMRPGGTLIMGTVDYGRPWWPLIERIYGVLVPQGYADEHISHYTLESLSQKLTEEGFRIEDRREILKGEITLKATAV